MVLYFGVRSPVWGCTVWRYEAGQLDYLDPQNYLRNHSPDGFEWGYSGSGPAQLALALLVDALESEKLALTLYQRFKFEVVAGLDEDSWAMEGDDVIRWAAMGTKPRVAEITGIALDDGGPFSVN